jgi:hypothetical protein
MRGRSCAGTGSPLDATPARCRVDPSSPLSEHLEWRPRSPRRARGRRRIAPPKRPPQGIGSPNRSYPPGVSCVAALEGTAAPRASAHGRCSMRPERPLEHLPEHLLKHLPARLPQGRPDRFGTLRRRQRAGAGRRSRSLTPLTGAFYDPRDDAQWRCHGVVHVCALFGSRYDRSSRSLTEDHLTPR